MPSLQQILYEDSMREHCGKEGEMLIAAEKDHGKYNIKTLKARAKLAERYIKKGAYEAVIFLDDTTAYRLEQSSHVESREMLAPVYSRLNTSYEALEWSHKPGAQKVRERLQKISQNSPEASASDANSPANDLPAAQNTKPIALPTQDDPTDATITKQDSANSSDRHNLVSYVKPFYGSAIAQDLTRSPGRPYLFSHVETLSGSRKPRSLARSPGRYSQLSDACRTSPANQDLARSPRRSPQLSPTNQDSARSPSRPDLFGPIDSAAASQLSQSSTSDTAPVEGRGNSSTSGESMTAEKPPVTSNDSLTEMFTRTSTADAPR